MSQIGGTGNYRHVSNNVSVNRLNVGERTRTQAGADLDQDKLSCPPATTRRHTTRPYHDRAVSWCVVRMEVLMLTLSDLF